jgi:hypothetical protein
MDLIHSWLDDHSLSPWYLFWDLIENLTVEGFWTWALEATDLEANWLSLGLEGDSTLPGIFFCCEMDFLGAELYLKSFTWILSFF